ncbi:hypothetical protein PCIT_a1351 [Pseudoalteromonas citrea]|uniref:Uncharacterized protein n=1 Tax=Pseudoalteromonas citrea TaxID=43655 RepID=A0AAD4FTN0_9GAMM|nr:hypothetical protein PCIT_a1351 [Pseudoalteromonas citrea]
MEYYAIDSLKTMKKAPFGALLFFNLHYFWKSNYVVHQGPTV